MAKEAVNTIAFGGLGGDGAAVVMTLLSECVLNTI